MAVCIATKKRVNSQLNPIKSYEPFITDDTCDEIGKNAKELNLKVLFYFSCIGDLLLNYDQCLDVINIEIPALRAKPLSPQALEALAGIEFAIKDTDNPYALLFLEGA